jgi:formaldehyde-activating enzyme involved in methanogenesis
VSSRLHGASQDSEGGFIGRMFVFALVGTLMATLANAKSFGPAQAEVMRAVATNVQMGIVPGSGHK